MGFLSETATVSYERRRRDVLAGGPGGGGGSPPENVEKSKQNGGI